MHRRTLLAGLPAAAAALPPTFASSARSVSVVAAADLPEEERVRHEGHMARALELAEAGGGPFASVIVDRRDGRVLCQAKNRPRESRILHGELVAILACAELEPRVDTRAVTLYTTAEPCPMCMSAIVWSRIPEMVYGTSLDQLIALGSNQFRLDSPTVAAAAPCYSGRIVAGVLAERSNEIYGAWARDRR